MSQCIVVMTTKEKRDIYWTNYEYIKYLKNKHNMKTNMRGVSMFFVIKLNRNKIFMVIVIILIVAAVIGIGYKVISNYSVKPAEVPTSTYNQSESSKAVKFIEEFGWKVDLQPVETEEFQLPKEFDTLYKRYNQYQIDIGLDLTPYKGKRVKRYTYKVLNYQLPTEHKDKQVYADVIVHGGKIIAGDLKTNEISGFMVSLKNRNFKEITGIDEWMFR